MKFSEYLKEQHMSTTRGTDDTYPELFMDWWGELELEDLDRLAEGWLEDFISHIRTTQNPQPILVWTDMPHILEDVERWTNGAKTVTNYKLPGHKETRENLSKLTIRKD